VALLLAGLLPRAADADLIELNATGVVTEITNALLESQFSLNQPMSVMMIYDADTPAGTSLILTRSLYEDAILDGSFDIGGYLGTISGGDISIADDDVDFDDAISWRGDAGAPSIPALPPTTQFSVRLNDDTRNAISSQALPLDTLSIAGFADRTWFLEYGIGIGSETGVGGRLTSLELSVRKTDVAEPSSLLLMMVGAVALSVAGARSHQRRRG
jgi:hypothetical protein